MHGDLQPLLTAEEVGHLLHLKPATIYDAVAKGRIPAVRLWTGSRRSVIRFEPDAIKRIIRERSSVVQRTEEVSQ